MSGIFGLFNQDAAPVLPHEMESMASLLELRGPDRTGIWGEASVGLGHTLLATTPESLFEQLPLRHAETGCLITADVRLDNRLELLGHLGIAERAPNIGDAEIILLTYLSWGESCVERLLGDFAFGIWDPRTRQLFCARDYFGMRPLYYHHTPGRFLAFASEPRAILVLPQTPYRINEGRIADFLVNELEGIDKTSTFFEEVYRLPPAHTLTVTPDHFAIRRYWALEPGPELKLPSDQAYAEAFLEVFTEAVRCRLRTAGPVGSMLSGGMDSGSVVAIARELLAQEGRGPLPTFSAVSNDPESCVETRTIHEALTMNGLEPRLVSLEHLDALMPALGELTWNLEEPFDNHMTLPRAIYLSAHRSGCKVLLDGVAGDAVLSGGGYLARLIRAGRWFTARRVAKGQTDFYGSNYPVWRQLYSGARAAFVPNAVRRARRQLFGGRRVDRALLGSLINRGFAKQVCLVDRLRRLDSHCSPGLAPTIGQQRAEVLDHPYQVVGRERYDRVASALAVEPRDPFLDRRVVDLSVSLPGEQTLHDGWPKAVLRRAMTGTMPDAVRWRQGKEHLGWFFTSALMERGRERMQCRLETAFSMMARYIDTGTVRQSCRAYLEAGDSSHAHSVYDAAHLCSWLGNWVGRPRPTT